MSSPPLNHPHRRPATETTAEIRVRGRTLLVPALHSAGKTITITGGWLKRAELRDEELVDGDLVADAMQMIADLRKASSSPDLFILPQKFFDEKPRLPFRHEWDNAAAIPITSYDDWWKGLPQESRKNARYAAKKGIDVRSERYSDVFTQGVTGIYNETPIRQGRRFWHYGKSAATIRPELETYADRSDLVGAWCGDELAGFIKMVYVDQSAELIHILAMQKHHNSRIMNALLAGAVARCAEKGIKFLVYGKYIYDGKLDSSLTEFKRRNGFLRYNFPRYFIPTSSRGKIALHLGLHHGIREWIPLPIRQRLLQMRTRIYQRSLAKASQSHATPQNESGATQEKI